MVVDKEINMLQTDVFIFCSKCVLEYIKRVPFVKPNFSSVVEFCVHCGYVYTNVHMQVPKCPMDNFLVSMHLVTFVVPLSNLISLTNCLSNFLFYTETDNLKIGKTNVPIH